GSVLLLSGDASSLLELVVVSAAVVAGYATFIGRNLDVYSDGQTDAEPAEEFRP
ncbi:hypothetical protein GRX66_19320, partial [Halobacterium sp. PCN9]|nr:hypothetical protein [Halobacterium bonnevillei]